MAGERARIGDSVSIGVVNKKDVVPTEFDPRKEVLVEAIKRLRMKEAQQRATVKPTDAYNSGVDLGFFNGISIAMSILSKMLEEFE